MSSLKKKSNRRINTKSGNANVIGDVTIDNFANASPVDTKFKGAVITNLFSKGATAQKEDKYLKKEVNEIDKKGRNNMSMWRKNSRGALANQRRIERTSSYEQSTEEKGIDYPLDIWFIISEYITPEAVGKFARICRSSYYVTTTGKFWFHLYKSYYRFVPGLPERLQPQCMVRAHELRACVIRTLHNTYFALRRNIDDVSYLRQDQPHSLIKRQCCLMWHKVGKMRCYFYFKLKEMQRRRNNSLRQKMNLNNKKTDFIEMLEDVAVNPEEGCKILRVTCLKYNMLPPVIGLILQSVSMTLMPGYKNYRLQLGFGTSDIPNSLTNQVILTDVLDCQILDWWHPTYPHQDGATPIQLPPSDFWNQSLL